MHPPVTTGRGVLQTQIAVAVVAVALFCFMPQYSDALRHVGVDLSVMSDLGRAIEGLAQGAAADEELLKPKLCCTHLHNGCANTGISSAKPESERIWLRCWDH